MIDSITAQDRCAQLLDAAKAAGADTADAIARAESSEGVSVRLGKLEDVERSEGEEIGLRVFVGRRSASVHTSDFSAAAFAELAERAVAMAKLAPEDPYAGLAPSEALLLGEADIAALDLKGDDEPGPDALRDRALEAEDAARAVDGVTNSEGSSASYGHAVVALATSNGFSGGYEGAFHSIYSSVISGNGADMQRDSASRSARHLEDLLPPAEIGALAGQRAVAKSNPGAMRSRAMPVVFDPRIGGSLLGHLTGAMLGPSIARKSSFLLGKEEDGLFPHGIRIVEDPLKPRGMRSRPFDGEGVATTQRTLVENGRITGWLTNVASAAQLGLPLTGHASRSVGGAPGVGVANLELAAGEVSREELIADISEGVLITEIIGQGVNGVTGDYSRGAVGFRIEHGEITSPVSEFTIAGNLLDMFANLRAADDLETWRAINVPTLRIEGMTVAGDG